MQEPKTAPAWHPDEECGDSFDLVFDRFGDRVVEDGVDGIGIEGGVGVLEIVAEHCVDPQNIDPDDLDGQVLVDQSERAFGDHGFGFGFKPEFIPRHHGINDRTPLGVFDFGAGWRVVNLVHRLPVDGSDGFIAVGEPEFLLMDGNREMKVERFGRSHLRIDTIELDDCPKPEREPGDEDEDDKSCDEWDGFGFLGVHGDLMIEKKPRDVNPRL